MAEELLNNTVLWHRNMWTILICAEHALWLRVLWFCDWHAVFTRQTTPV